MDLLSSSDEGTHRRRPDLQLPGHHAGYKFDPETDEEEEEEVVEEEAVEEIQEEEEEEDELHSDGDNSYLRRSLPIEGVQGSLEDAQRQQQQQQQQQQRRREQQQTWAARRDVEERSKQVSPKDKGGEEGRAQTPQRQQGQAGSLSKESTAAAAAQEKGRRPGSASAGEDAPVRKITLLPPSQQALKKQRQQEEERRARRERQEAALEAKKDADEQKSMQWKRAEFVSTLRRLEEKRAQTEQEVAATVYGKRGGASASDNPALADYALLEEQSIKMGNEASQERMRLMQHVAKIRFSVEQFKVSLESTQTATPSFMERVKKAMDTIEASIAAYKSEQREIYQRLLDDETLLEKEVDSYAKKIEAWESAGGSEPGAAGTSGPSIKGAQSSSGDAGDAQGDLLPEVVEFEAFEAKHGGRNGGWEEYDHGTFLRLRKKLKGGSNLDEFTAAVASALAGQTEASARAHEMWFREYNRLLERKKRAIEAWRVAKEAERQQHLEKAEEEKRKLRDEEQRRAEKQAEELRKEREAQAQQIKEWKEARRQEEEAVLRKKQEAAQRSAREKERMRKEHDEDIRQRATEYLAQKKDEERRREALEAARQQAEREARRVKDEDLAWFRERDLQAQAEKLAKKQKEEEEERERQARLDKIRQKVEAGVKVKRDPSRLYQLNESAKNRLKDKSKDESLSGAGLYIRAVPHLAVPTWRKGL